MSARIGQIQDLLRDRSLSAAILRLPDDVLFCSQYFPRNSFAFVFVPVDGAPCLIAPEGDQDDPDRSTIKDVRRFGWVKLTDGNPYWNVKAILEGLKREHGIPDAAHLGVDTNPDTISPCLCFGEMMPMGRSTIDMIAAAFRTDELVEITQDVRTLRAVKLDEEIPRIELANQIGMRALAKFADMARSPGLREIDLAAEIEAFVAVTAPGYANQVKFGRAIAQVTSGAENTAAAWFAGMISTDRVVEAGDFVMLEVGITVDGYWCDLTKTVVAGSPSDTQRTMLKVVDDAQRSAISAMQSGVSAGVVDEIARGIVRDAGLGDRFVHALGHGVGFSYHDGEPVFVPGSVTSLEPGMVCSCEPGVYVPGVGGVRQEVNVLLACEGARILGHPAS